MAVIDVITYNGEKELFEIRYNILKDYVDEFIVVEFDKTFSGKPKEWQMIYDGVKPKVSWKGISEDVYSKYKELAENSPNTKGAENWKTEFMQKESIKDCLLHLKDDDLVFIGDCDEIWSPETLNLTYSKLKLKVYTYYLNNKSSEVFWGTIVSHYRMIKDECLNHLRTQMPTTLKDYGWHFTSMGGYKAVEKKLLDSYTEESYANEVVMTYLGKNIQENKDFLGRPFTYKVDESEWPEWLKEHGQDYQYMLK